MMASQPAAAELTSDSVVDVEKMTPEQIEELKVKIQKGIELAKKGVALAKNIMMAEVETS